MLIGYARVSSGTGQNPDHQVDALVRAGVAAENIHVEHAGGAKASRPSWTWRWRGYASAMSW
jgi:hypothetical protein